MLKKIIISFIFLSMHYSYSFASQNIDRTQNSSTISKQSITTLEQLEEYRSNRIKESELYYGQNRKDILDNNKIIIEELNKNKKNQRTQKMILRHTLLKNKYIEILDNFHQKNLQDIESEYNNIKKRL